MPAAVFRLASLDTRLTIGIAQKIAHLFVWRAGWRHERQVGILWCFRPPFLLRQLWLRDWPTEQHHALLISLSGEGDGGMVVQAVSTGSLGRRFRLASLWQEVWHQKGRASLVCAVSQSHREHWLLKIGGREIRPERVYRLELGNVSLPQLWIGANQRNRLCWDARCSRRQEVLALLISAVGTGRFKSSQTVRPEQRYKRHRCRPSNYGGV